MWFPQMEEGEGGKLSDRLLVTISRPILQTNLKHRPEASGLCVFEDTKTFLTYAILAIHVVHTVLVLFFRFPTV